jgi:hypothetical protein
MGDLDYESAASWGLLSLLYSIPLCIVALVQANQGTSERKSYIDQLIKLGELKQQGIVSETEFDFLKSRL